MKIPAIIFTKKAVSDQAHQVLFCVEQEKLVEFDLAVYSPEQFASKNNFIRHDKFDWYVNQKKPICFTFENQADLQELILNFAENPFVTWKNFPQAVKTIQNGTHRNLLQLVVQYISYGLIDDSVIAAEYDKEWLDSLKTSN